MPKESHLRASGRRFSGEEMFLSEDRKSLHRGKRSLPRTKVCRPCLIWFKDHEEKKFPGVVMDMNIYGMLVRSIESLDKGSEVFVQLMRDDQYQYPLASPLDCEVIRKIRAPGELSDHGLKIIQKSVRRPESRPYIPDKTYRGRKEGRTRMHTIDYTVGGRTKHRKG